MTAPATADVRGTPGASPRVSVVMAVHDGARWVRDGVGSLLAQTFADFELLVVDDGSTDDTADVLRSIDDPRLRVLHNARNLGLAASLNRGLVAARGELVARQDVDDRSTPHRLARQVAFMDAHPDVALVGSWYTEIDADGAPLAAHRLPTAHADILWALHLYSPFVHSAVLWRRVPVRDAVGEYDERLTYSMDFDLWRRIADRFPVANLPEPLLELRVHDTSMTATYGERATEGRRMRAERAASLLAWPAGDALARFDRLYALLHGPVRARSSREIVRDVRDLLRLHAAFVRERGIAAPVADRQRAVMARVLRHRLREGARCCAAAGRRVDAMAHRAGALLAGMRRTPRAERAGRGRAAGV